MIKFFANQNISTFKKGDEVPEDIAKVWMEMYKESPVDSKVVPDKFDKSLDLNKDGKVDVEDQKIATKITNDLKKVIKSKK